MNQGVLKRVKSISDNWVIAEAEDTGRLFCNGHMVVPAGDGMGVGGECHNLERMTTGMQKLWRESVLGNAIERGELCGHNPIARRFQLADMRLVHFNERYVRCFDANALFHGEDPYKYFVVTEGGVKVGIIMPIRGYDSMNTWTEIPDEILFHKCPSETSHD